jgi:hypothetical protein
MSSLSSVIAFLMESDEDEDFSIKDLTEPGDELHAGPTKVERHGRIKIVDTDRYTFLISYLTPVAIYDKVFRQYYRTSKHWSPTTEKHIDRWRGMIRNTPEWRDNPANWEKADWNPGGHYVRYPKFKIIGQAKLSKLFRDLIPTMEMKPHEKRRMYHVDPRMRRGSEVEKTWLSAHLKHHDTGKEGLPRPDEPGYEEFFADFDPPEPETFDWGSGYRDTSPRERYKPDEE